jgi:phosphatidylserine decarboxylase
VSPADGTVLHVGKVVDGEVKQVKGVNYKLADFLGEHPLPDIEPEGTLAVAEFSSQYNELGLPRNDSITNLFQSFPHLAPRRGNELHHVVVYLGVADYHHFHSPADWNVQMRRHIVGKI